MSAWHINVLDSVESDYWTTASALDVPSESYPNAIELVALRHADQEADQ